MRVCLCMQTCLCACILSDMGVCVVALDVDLHNNVVDPAVHGPSPAHQAMCCECAVSTHPWTDDSCHLRMGPIVLSEPRAVCAVGALCGHTPLF